MSAEGHGWKPIKGIAVPPGTGVEFAAIVEPRHRCTCRNAWPHCANRATQEDLRCDYCREHCP